MKTGNGICFVAASIALILFAALPEKAFGQDVISSRTVAVDGVTP